MKKLLDTDAAYMAGFLDADGSLVAQFKKNETFAIDFQFQLTVQFTQDVRNKHVLERFQKDTELGTIRIRKKNPNTGSQICDFIITAVEQNRDLLMALKPFVRMKKGQLNNMLRIIEFSPQMKKSLKVFSEVCDLTDKISAANYSKSNRINTGAKVLEYVIVKKFFDKLDPVETSTNKVDFKVNGDQIDDLPDFE